ncbi:hypothetical protein BLNAU_22091 [Blattamonas nauphoetae]|uniref:Uncharacterized protein n=1 Tax=Blattamonas nauphoetae TaxID=2049346 RepID=A0ABQ9WU11_9EUKA|nr:hypothetical protein BLNAU_22091 [Blattamonas nauphoetae]
MNAGRTQSLSFDEVKQRITALHNGGQEGPLSQCQQEDKGTSAQGEKIRTRPMVSTRTPHPRSTSQLSSSRDAEKRQDRENWAISSLCLERNYLPQAWCVGGKQIDEADPMRIQT